MKYTKVKVFVCFTGMFFFKALPVQAQIVAVNVVQNMNFGAFYQGGIGGTITISNAGVRTVTGTVVAVNFGVSYFQAMFDVSCLLVTNVSITNGPNVTLTGSNGGTMSLNIGTSNPASPFSGSIGVLRVTRVNIGGTLTVGSPAVCPPGTYSGSFFVTFNNQ